MREKIIDVSSKVVAVPIVEALQERFPSRNFTIEPAGEVVNILSIGPGRLEKGELNEMRGIAGGSIQIKEELTITENMEPKIPSME